MKKSTSKSTASNQQSTKRDIIKPYNLAQLKQEDRKSIPILALACW